jgi:hypothetical protein
MGRDDRALDLGRGLVQEPDWEAGGLCVARKRAVERPQDGA